MVLQGPVWDDVTGIDVRRGVHVVAGGGGAKMAAAPWFGTLKKSARVIPGRERV